MKLVPFLAAALVALSAQAAQAQIVRAWIAPWQTVRVPTPYGPIALDDSGSGLQVYLPGDGTSGVVMIPSGDGLVVSLPGSATPGQWVDLPQGFGTIGLPNNDRVTIGGEPSVSVSFPSYPAAPPLTVGDNGSDGLVVSFPGSGAPGLTLDPNPGGGLSVFIPGGATASVPTDGGVISLPGGSGLIVSIPYGAPMPLDPDPGVTTLTIPNGTWIQIPINGWWVWRRIAGTIRVVPVRLGAPPAY